MLKELVYKKTSAGIRVADFSVAGQAEFHPFPQYHERTAWDIVDTRIRSLILKEAEPFENFSYPSLTAQAYRAYALTGDRAGYEAPHDLRRKALATLTLAECLTGDGARLNTILDGIWCICEESSWVLPAHNFIYEPEEINGERTLPDPDLPTLDIFAGETAMLLSMVHYLLGKQLDAIDPLITRRIRRELKRRIITPFLTRYDYWWMGYSDRRDINNWGPWCIMNCLTCVLLCEPENDLRKRAVVRAMDELDYYLKGIAQDGGCDEGATYWGRSCGMLLEGFDLLSQAAPHMEAVYQEEKLVNFANYIRKLYVGGDYVVNFADGAARCNPAAELLYTAGVRMHDCTLKDFGAYCFGRQLALGMFPTSSLTRAMMSIKRSAKMLERCAGKLHFDKSCFMESLGVMVARETENPDCGLFVCAKAGCNGDSHNHNDVGNAVVFYNAQPVLVDIGVEVYRREFFGTHRYEIWTMQSQYHNLPTVNGVMQEAGAAYAATAVQYAASESVDTLQMNIATAYPTQSGLRSYVRTVIMDRDAKSVTLHDAWEMEHAESMEMHFITPILPKECEQGLCFATAKGNVLLTYEKDGWELCVESYPLTDTKLKSSWGEMLYRLVLTKKQVLPKGEAAFCLRAEEA
ncbi:MAG: heparinase II/III family protein [Ruthenibacterium sp.]